MVSKLQNVKVPDSSSDFLGALDAQSHMAVVVPNGNEGLETGPLSSAGLLLHGHDLQDIIFQGRAEKEVDNLELLKSIKTKLSKNYRRIIC